MTIMTDNTGYDQIKFTTWCLGQWLSRRRNTGISPYTRRSFTSWWWLECKEYYNYYLFFNTIQFPRRVINLADTYHTPIRLVFVQQICKQSIYLDEYFICSSFILFWNIFYEYITRSIKPTVYSTPADFNW